MNTTTLRIPAMVLALAGLTALAGCVCPKKEEPAPPPPKAAPPPKPVASTPTRCTWPTRSSDNAWNCSGLAYPTGDARTSAVAIEKCVPREARLGAPVEYEIVATNLTSAELGDVVVTDQPNNVFKYVKSTPAANAGSDGTLTWALGDLKPCESKTIRVSGTAAAEGTISNCATVTYSSTLCAAIPVVSPKLKIVKTGPAEVTKCDEIVYNIEVTNAGTGTVSNVKVTDSLPAGLKTVDGKQSADFAVGNLAAGQSRKVSARVVADKTGRFENKATATADGGLSVESTVVATVVKQPVLTIARKCPTKQFIGRPLDYQITVTNTGDAQARDTIVEDTMANGTTFASASDGGKASGGKVTWNLGTLEPKATKTLSWSASPAGAGVYSGTATARAHCAAQVTDTCQVEVTGVPAILLEVVDISDPVKVGENETYVITVTNQGTAVDTNIVLTCMLEANQQYVSSTGATNGTASGNTVTFAPLASLAAKEKATWKVVVKNVKVGDVRFKATMDSDQLTRNVEETEATNVYE